MAAWTNQFCSSKMLQAANIRKARGATVGALLRLLLAAPFGEFSIWKQAGGGPKLRVVFVRDTSDPTRWIGLASTDTEITPDRVCRIYSKRWAIEVFFKQAKQQLGLASEVQVRSYTACVAHTSIVFLRYMILAFYRRQQTDQRTIPGLFFAACQQLQALALGCCLQIILLEWLQEVSRTGSSGAFEAACRICGVAEQFLENLHDNSILFKPLSHNCES